MDNAHGKEGALTIQLPALDKHALSKPHKNAAQQWRLKAHKDVLPIQKHVELMMDGEKQHVLSVMQTMYFIAIKDLPLNFFSAQCKFLRYMHTRGLPINDVYSAYTNRTSGMQFLKAARDLYWESLKDSILKSPFFSVSIDDNTDLSYEMYVTYLEEGGNGPCVCRFVALLPLEDGKAQTKFDALKSLIERMGLSFAKMIGFASDGASCMRGVNNGVLAKLKEKVPNIIGVHCVAHREALVVFDACDKLVEFGFLDAFADRVYAWVGRSTIRHKNLDNLMKAFTLRPLEVLRIHTVRWLSRGKVMQRLVNMMPALLSDFKEHDALLYKVATTFQVQFFIQILADILFEMNVLNKKFQNDHLDITKIANALDVVIELFKKCYLGNSFGYGSKNYKEFIDKVKDNVLAYTKEDGFIERHILHFSTLPNSSSGGSIEGCITLAKLYVEELISGIDARFTRFASFQCGQALCTF
ncbi:hypothetical protein L7F22_048093 [Adiantum nelumboides]|nr:hypothetical protein [Adiantum nelumboides]